MEGLLKKLHEVFGEYFNTLPSWHFRDKTGNHEFMEIYILDSMQPDPFPCITIKVYPNGKPNQQSI